MVDLVYGLTLHRPWPWCIFHGSKNADGTINEKDADYTKSLENRTWAPPVKVIGTRIAIHAGKRYNKDAANKLAAQVYGVRLPRKSFDEGIIGTAVICGVVIAPPSSLDRPAGQPVRLSLVMGEWGSVGPLGAAGWFSGPYGWLLDQRIALKTPVPCMGFQKLWRLPEFVVEQINAQSTMSTSLP